MGKGSRAFVALLAGAIVSACVPGRRGWSCSSNADCDPGLECKEFGSLFSDHVCVTPGTTSIRSSETYGWFKLIVIDGFALFFAVIIAFAVGAILWDKISEAWNRARTKE